MAWQPDTFRYGRPWMMSTWCFFTSGPITRTSSKFAAALSVGVSPPVTLG